MDDFGALHDGFTGIVNGIDTDFNLSDFQGTMDEIQIYQRALSADEIEQLSSPPFAASSMNSGTANQSYNNQPSALVLLDAAFLSWSAHDDEDEDEIVEF